jgi:hypothetical protein
MVPADREHFAVRATRALRHWRPCQGCRQATTVVHHGKWRASQWARGEGKLRPQARRHVEQGFPGSWSLQSAFPKRFAEELDIEQARAAGQPQDRGLAPMIVEGEQMDLAIEIVLVSVELAIEILGDV